MNLDRINSLKGYWKVLFINTVTWNWLHTFRLFHVRPRPNKNQPKFFLQNSRRDFFPLKNRNSYRKTSWTNNFPANSWSKKAANLVSNLLREALWVWALASELWDRKIDARTQVTSPPAAAESKIMCTGTAGCLLACLPAVAAVSGN